MTNRYNRRDLRAPIDRMLWADVETYPPEDLLLLSDRAMNRGIFDRSELERFLAEHDRGHWNHGHRIRAMLFLEVWFRTFVDAAAPEGPLHLT